MAIGLTPAQIMGARAIITAARAHGVNPIGMLAVALNESNLNPSALGDAGTSYGLFQLHRGGALPAGWSQAMADNPLTNANFAAAAIARGARGLSPAATQAYQTLHFERPQNPAGDMSAANLARAASIYAGLSGSAPLTGAALGGSPSYTAGGVGGMNAQDVYRSLGIGAGSDVAQYLNRILSMVGSPGGGATAGMGVAPPSGAAGRLFGGPYTMGRTDYGVDFAYPGSARVPAYALGSGTIERIGSGWGHVNAPYQSGTALYLKLDHPIGGQPYLYYAEGTPVAGIRAGQRVAAGQPLMYNPGEIGIIPTPYTSTMYQTPQPTGLTFRDYLRQVGIG